MTCNIAGALTVTMAATLLLAACSPQDQCIWRNTGEYRTISGLLEETEGNLVRGYAWRERPVTRTEWRECPRVIHDKEGNAIVVPVSCPRTVTDTERYRVPIDPVSETRKRDNLRAHLAKLEPGAKAAISACRAAYPEDRR